MDLNFLTAQVSAIIPCGVGDKSSCTVCDLFILFGNVMQFVLNNILFPLIVIMIIYAGARMIIARGNPAEFEKGKDTLWNVIWGFFIALAAFTIVDTIIKYFVDPSFFTSGGFGFWNDFPSCPR